MLELRLSYVPGRVALGEQPLLASRDLEKQRGKAVMQTKSIPGPGEQGGDLQVPGSLLKDPSQASLPRVILPLGTSPLS